MEVNKVDTFTTLSHQPQCPYKWYFYHLIQHLTIVVCFPLWILDDQDDTMMDPYWSQASSPASNYDWNQFWFDLSEYFHYSSGPSSPSTITSEDEDVKWRIEYDREIKKHRPKNPEIGFYIDINIILRPNGWIHAGLLPSTRGIHTCDCRCHTCYDWTKEPSISYRSTGIRRSMIYSITSSIWRSMG